MDIYRYLNSRDIREYLRKIKYEFNSVEAAWIIWSCESIKPRTKVRLWKEIMNTMPNSIYTYRLGKKYSQERDCFEWLTKYIEICKKYSLEIDRPSLTNIPDDEADYLLYFEEMCFNFPVPFKTGDIVCLKGRYQGLIDNKPCVYITSNFEYKQKYPNWNGLDYTDMFFSAYILGESGKIFSETELNYMNLEYYRGEIRGSERTVILFSKYLKGAVDGEALANAYLRIIMEGLIEYSTAYYIEDYLKEIGAGKSTYKYPYIENIVSHYEIVLENVETLKLKPEDVLYYSVSDRDESVKMIISSRCEKNITDRLLKCSDIVAIEKHYENNYPYVVRVPWIDAGIGGEENILQHVYWNKDGNLSINVLSDE